MESVGGKRNRLPFLKMVVSSEVEILLTDTLELALIVNEGGLVLVRSKLVRLAFTIIHLNGEIDVIHSTREVNQREVAVMTMDSDAERIPLILWLIPRVSVHLMVLVRDEDTPQETRRLVLFDDDGVHPFTVDILLSISQDEREVIADMGGYDFFDEGLGEVHVGTIA